MQAAYESVCTKIASLYTDPKPDYSIDGRSYSWATFRKQLLEEQKMLLAAIQDAQGPFEVISYGK